MKRVLFTLVLGLISVNLFSQSVIVAQKGESIYTHTRLDTVVKYAEPGSTIYLPGGNVLLFAELLIDKELHLVGAGHYPDSSKATGVTFISGGNIRFTEGASYSSMTGIYFYNDLFFAKNIADAVNFVDITRCNIGFVNFGAASNTRNCKTANIRFSETVIRSQVYGADAQNILIEKCFLGSQLLYFSGNARFTNCVFNFYDYWTDVFNVSSAVVVENSVFTRDSHGLTGSQLNNNLFVVNVGAEPGGTNLGTGNIGNKPLADIFVNYDGGVFSYTYDFHMKEGSPGIAAGKDGTDIGLYGSESPYKPSAVPHNPHIRYVKIAKETASGQLPVEIHVSAQDK